MVDFAKRVTNSHAFCVFITACIVLNAVLLGVETSRTVMERAGGLLHVGNWFFKIVFLIEIVLRIIATHPNYRRFFRDGWNVFDFVIVAVTTVPWGGEFANVGRVLRLLRVIRLVSISPDLRLIIGTMVKSIPSMGHVILLLGMLLYVYGVAGFYMFHTVDPENWGTLGRSVLTLFQVITVEGWPDFMHRLLEHRPWAWLFFASFIVVGVFVVINLFIAVIMNNLEKAREEEQDKADRKNADHDLLDRLERMRKDIEALEAVLRKR